MTIRFPTYPIKGWDCDVAAVASLPADKDADLIRYNRIIVVECLYYLRIDRILIAPFDSSIPREANTYGMGGLPEVVNTYIIDSTHPAMETNSIWSYASKKSTN